MNIYEDGIRERVRNKTKQYTSMNAESDSREKRMQTVRRSVFKIRTNNDVMLIKERKT